MTAATIYTVGHSNHALETFLDLLSRHSVQVLVDTRSIPKSAYTPHFDREPLGLSVMNAGVRYVFLGHELGGRPDGAMYYDAEGHVLYDRVARSASFLRGIEKLERAAGKSRLALLCSEEDPSTCHRKLLIARVLRERGMCTLHIRADGRLQTDDELDAEIAARKGEAGQERLFDAAEVTAWRSLRSVLPKRPQRDSSSG